MLRIVYYHYIIIITSSSSLYICHGVGPLVDPFQSKGNNPTTGLTLLWARNPFRGNFNHWQVSRKF